MEKSSLIRDFHTSTYCNILWITDLLNAKEVRNRQFQCESLDREKSSINFIFQNVGIFGTIIEIKNVFEKGILYSLDDGTGVIVCKFNTNISKTDKIIETAKTALEKTRTQENSLYDSIMNTFNSEDTTNDSVFNDKTTQAEDIEGALNNKVMALSSLWETVLNTFTESSYSIGDTVYVQGKLYKYFNEKQIYINSIRILSHREEIILMRKKLEDGIKPPVMEPMKTTDEIAVNMTFDNIDSNEVNWSQNSEVLSIKTPKRLKLETKKRHSVVKPETDSIITFDSFSQQINEVCELRLGKVIPESDEEL